MQPPADWLSVSTYTIVVFSLACQVLAGMSGYGEPKRQIEAADAVMAALGSGSGTQVDVAINTLCSFAAPRSRAPPTPSTKT